jgi:hypothetical protein
MPEVKRLRFGVRQCSAAFRSRLFPGAKAAEHRRSPKRGRRFKRKLIAERREICIIRT